MEGPLVRSLTRVSVSFYLRSFTKLSCKTNLKLIYIWSLRTHIIVLIYMILRKIETGNFSYMVKSSPKGSSSNFEMRSDHFIDYR